MLRDSVPLASHPDRLISASPQPTDKRRRPWISRGLFGVCGTVVALIFAANVWHFSFIGDDAFISFRYAQHLVDGHGLVWNVDDRVEGYTNFLWVLLIAAGMALGLSPEPLSWGLGIACGAAVLLIVLGYGIRSYGWRRPLIWLAPAALALNRSFAAWCTGGLETQLFTLLVVGGYLLLLREVDRTKQPQVLSAFVLGAATLCRPDGAVFAAAAGLVLLAFVIVQRGGWVPMLRWGFAYLGLPGLHLVWRLYYYGQWLPNTFYAKVNGAWWDQAAAFFYHFNADYHLAGYLLLLPLALSGRRLRHNTLMLGGVSAYCLYLAYVGGDRFDFRLLVPCLPLFYLLVAACIDQLGRLARVHRVRRWQLRTTAFVVGLSLLLGTAHGLWREAARENRSGIASVQAIGNYAASRANQGKILRVFIDRGLLPADLVVGIGGAGAIPFYTMWRSIDFRGLNDVDVARQPVHERGTIGHEHRASLQHMYDRGVEVFDFANGPVQPNRSAVLRSTMRKLDKKARRWNNESQAQGSSVQIFPECRVLSKKWALVVGRMRSEAEFERRLGHLPRCKL